MSKPAEDPTAGQPSERPTASSFRLSVTFPVYNEEQALPELLSRVGAVLDGIEGGPHEIVAVDDGSRDGSVALLEAAAADDPRLKLVKLSRNFGHQAAVSAGLDHVNGDAVVVMDADLQDPPEAIPRFLELYREGYDVVYAQRVGRKVSWPLRAAFFLFYRILDWLSDVSMPLDAGDFSLISRRVVKALRRAPEHHRYLRGLRAWTGFRQVGIPIERGERWAGESKYSLRQRFEFAFDGIFSFTLIPLRLVTMVGAFTILITSLYGTYALLHRLWLGASPRGFTALALTIIFMSGVILLFLGVIGEYVGRIYEEVKNRPLYVIDRVSDGRSSAGDHLAG